MEKTAKKKVLVTRALKQAEKMITKLERAGLEPVICPVIEFKPPVNWGSVDAAIEKLNDYDWIIFASANAVSFFVERCIELRVDFEKFNNIKIGAIGSQTKRALEKSDLTVNYYPNKYTAEEFVEQFPGRDEFNELKILWPRTNVGRTLIYDAFTKDGANVTMLEVYRTELPENFDEISMRLFNLLSQREVDIIMVASSQTTRNLVLCLKKGMIAYARTQGFIINSESKALEPAIKSMLSTTTIASIGPITTSTAIELLGKVDIEPEEQTITALIDAIQLN